MYLCFFKITQILLLHNNYLATTYLATRIRRNTATTGRRDAGTSGGERRCAIVASRTKSCHSHSSPFETTSATGAAATDADQLGQHAHAMCSGQLQ